jgi:hypothetical protein
MTSPRHQRRPHALRPVLAATLALVATLVCAVGARADIGETIILRCTHNESLSGFSQSAYRKALKELSADTEEYSDCSSRIRAAQLAAASGSTGGPGQGPAAPAPLAPTPAQQQALVRAQHVAGGPIKLGAHIVDPGVVHVGIASALSSLPTPLLATLAFLFACALVFAGGALRNRIRAHRAA